MKPVYVKGILAGVAGGIALTVVLLLRTALDRLVLPYLYSPGSSSGMAPLISMSMSLLIYGLYGVIMLLIGALAVWMARELIDNFSEALIASGISGAIAGIIWVVVSSLITVISMLLMFPLIASFDSPTGAAEMSILGAVLGMNVCCCGPVFLVFAIVMAMIGGGACGLIVDRQNA